MAVINIIGKNVAAIYIRLSVEDEDKKDESESIKNQRMILTEYAQKMNWQIYNIYCDEDFSGLDSQRPEFNKMLNAAKRGEFNIILCKSQSRFTRDMEVAEKYINRLFYLWGIRFVSLTDNIDSFNSATKKARQINSLINEWYCEDLSQSINAVFKSKMKRGEFIGSFAPFGYKKSPLNKNRLEIDEEAAEIVRLIFKLCIEGNGMRKIANYLSENNIPTPTEYKTFKSEKFFNPNYNKNLPGIWSAGTVRNILKNPVYTGDMVQGKTKKLSCKSRKVISVKPENRINAPSTHTPIIDKSDFETAAMIIQKRGRYHTKSNLDSVLYGKIFCGKCGFPFIRGSLNREKTDFYYICSLKRKTRCGCDNKGILSGIIENEIFSKIKEIYSIPIDENYNVEKDFDKKSFAEKNRDSYKLKSANIGEYERELSRLYSDFKQGIFEKDEFIIIKKNLFNTYFKRQPLNESNPKQNSNRFSSLLKQKRLSSCLVSHFIEKITVEEVNNKNERNIIIYWKI